MRDIPRISCMLINGLSMPFTLESQCFSGYKNPWHTFLSLSVSNTFLDFFFFFFPKEKNRLYVDLFSHFTCEVRRN